jgi:hypothetical protein
VLGHRSFTDRPGGGVSASTPPPVSRCRPPRAPPLPTTEVSSNRRDTLSLGVRAFFRRGLVSLLGLAMACGLDVIGAGGGSAPASVGPDAIDGVDAASTEPAPLPPPDEPTVEAGAPIGPAGPGDGGPATPGDSGPPRICPRTCSGGCTSDGHLCIVKVTDRSAGPGPITCPDDFDCWVECSGKEVCTQPITCPKNHDCTVFCTGDQACTSGAKITRGTATSLCIECIGENFNPGCDSVSCTGDCTRACDLRGCGNSCKNCRAAVSCL